MVWRATLVAIALVAGVAGCKDGKKGVPDRTYTTRALVESVSATSKPRELLVKHEAIDDFVHSDGVMRGMDAMGIPLSVADSVDLAGIAKGDVIELDMEVVFRRDRPARIVRVRKLPADTKLVFRDARPPAKSQ